MVMLEINTEAVVRRFVADYWDTRTSPPRSVRAAAKRGRHEGECEMIALIFRLATPFAAQLDVIEAVKVLGERPAYESSRNAAQREYDRKMVANLRSVWEG